MAIAQSRQVAGMITERTGRPVEIVGVMTLGDVSRAQLTQIGGTGVFVSALREALLAGEVDLAVHSLKDLPAGPAPGIVLAAVPPRDDPRDALAARDGAKLADLPAGVRIGTSSPRRAAQLTDQPAGGEAGGRTDEPGTADGPGQELPGQAAGAQVPPDGSLDACGRERRLVTRTRERYAEIRGRLDAGESLSAISRATRLDRKTVQRFARAGSAEELLGKATSRESKLDDFTPYLHQRWNEGVTDAAALHAELREQGWTGSEQTVRRYVRPFRQALTAPDPALAVPKTRQITRWLLTRPDHLQAGEQAQLQAILARCPHLDALAGHVTAFAEMVTARTGSRDLEAWLTAVEADDQSGLRSLAIGIRNDQQAVTNGLTLDWNSGKVEGTVNKLR